MRTPASIRRTAPLLRARSSASIRARQPVRRGGLKVRSAGQRGGQSRGIDAAHAGLPVVAGLGGLLAEQVFHVLLHELHRLGHHHHTAGLSAQEGTQTLIGVLGVSRNEFGSLGEAGGSLLQVVLVADHQESLHAATAQGLRQPQGGGLKKQVLQHEGTAVSLPGQKYNGACGFHKISSRSFG